MVNHDAMFTKTRLVIIALIFSMLSCDKKSATTLPLPAYTATLKVTVLKFYLNNGNQQTDSTLRNTSVNIYSSEYYLNNHAQAEYSGTTDSAGIVVFNGLTQTQYYIQTSNSQFGIKTENVNTPLNAIALAEVDY